MSLFFCPTGAEGRVLRCVAGELAFGAAETIVHEGLPAYVWCDWDSSRFGPAKDPVTGVSIVISGRIALPDTEWQRASRLPFIGGLAARILLEKYLRGGEDAVTPYNGPAVVLIEDPRKGRVTFWTDQFGYHPCYVYRPHDPACRVVTTFPDLILCDPKADHSLDLISMAEFLRGWRAVPPNTYFESVKHVGAATKTTINLSSGEMTSTEYWRPFEDEFYADIDTAADALAAAVDIAIKERTAISERPLFMISGGADSRVLLFSTQNRSRVMAVNLYERLAAETAIAKKLSAIAGTKFMALQRDRDFYPRLLSEITRWSGGMWSAEDSHYFGFSDNLAEVNPDLVMTACTTDWVFKGYGLEKSYRQFFGKSVPFLKFEHVRREGFLPNPPTAAPSEMEDQIRERLDTWFSGCPDRLESPRDFLKVEDRRIRPTCYTVSVSGQIMARTYPYDTFLADSRIAECYSRIDPSWKLNREVWGKAAARICSDAGKIIDSNYGWAVDATIYQQAFSFALGWVGRRFDKDARADKKLTGREDRPPSSGSWPNCGWYAYNSPTLKALWNDAPPHHRDRLRVVAGGDPWDRPLEGWAGDGHRLMRMSTLLAHWRQIDARRTRCVEG